MEFTNWIFALSLRNKLPKDRSFLPRTRIDCDHSSLNAVNFDHLFGKSRFNLRRRLVASRTNDVPAWKRNIFLFRGASTGYLRSKDRDSHDYSGGVMVSMACSDFFRSEEQKPLPMRIVPYSEGAA